MTPPHQSISPADAIAEGIPLRQPGDLSEEYGCADYALEAYRVLWETIHGAGSWAKNRWVWVIECRRVKP